jgi:hypothetical protein
VSLLTPPEHLMRELNRGPSRVLNPIDPSPYYGGSDYRVNTNVPQDGVPVPIEMKDLTITHASQENIQKLQSQLNRLDGHQTVTDLYRSGVYPNESRAYYDPTTDATEDKKKFLRDTIDNMRHELNNSDFPKIEFGVEKGRTEVQNRTNANKELAADYIKNNWYPVNREEATRDARKSAYADGNTGPMIDADVSKITLGSKYVEQKPVENRVQPQEIVRSEEAGGVFTATNFKSETAKPIVNQVKPVIVEELKETAQTVSQVVEANIPSASVQEAPVQKVLREVPELPKQVDKEEKPKQVAVQQVQKVVEREAPKQEAEVPKAKEEKKEVKEVETKEVKKEKRTENKTDPEKNKAETSIKTAPKTTVERSDTNTTAEKSEPKGDDKKETHTAAVKPVKAENRTANTNQKAKATKTEPQKKVSKPEEKHTPVIKKEEASAAVETKKEEQKKETNRKEIINAENVETKEETKPAKEVTTEKEEPTK